MLLRLLGRETVETILSGLDALIHKLEALIAREKAKAAKELEQAKELYAKIDARHAQVERAAKVSSKIETLIE